MDAKRKLIERLEDKLLLNKQPNLVLYDKLIKLVDKIENLEGGFENLSSFIYDKKKIKELLAPVKGVDYFTDEEIQRFIEICTPVKGVDYFDGEKGEPGKAGKDGLPPEHEFIAYEKGSKLRFKKPNGAWGNWIKVESIKGDKGDIGGSGRPPEHEWDGTKLRFKHPNGRWGKFVDLKGKEGKEGSEIRKMYGGGSGIKVSIAGVKQGDTAENIDFVSGLNVTYEAPWKYKVVNPYTYPDLTGEANKVLAVKADESGVEWTTDAVNDLTGYDLQNQFKVATATSYSEPETTDVDGRITQVGYWDTVAKGTKLYEKEITYTDGLITEIVITDLITGSVLTKTRTYSSGAWASTTITIT